MSDFMERYLQTLEVKGSPLCVGLDPKPNHVPEEMLGRDVVGSIGSYLRKVIDLAAPEVVLVKPQFAYYEALGPEGITMMIETIEYAHEQGLLVILDHKVSDIGETMQMYAKACFDIYDVDLVTFVPYLGCTFLPEQELDPSWLPWLEKGRGIIPMIMTSNKKAGQLQHLMLEDGRMVYQAMADLVVDWAQQVNDLTGGAGTVAGVVGATYPDEAVEIRRRVGDELPFLVPGYGAQGGGAKGAIAGLPTDGVSRLFVNSSRGITLDSWYDRKNKVRREGDPIELIDAAIKNSKAELIAALQEAAA